MSTPVQRQYQELKSQNPDAILFFRLGDFYELFLEDAKVAARILGIVLTARHKGTENEMPMCGFPYHAHESYLETLIDQGYKVAIAEQVEDPETKKIHREVVRIVTPGTSMEEGNLDPRRQHFLVSVVPVKSDWFVSHVDISTGHCAFSRLASQEMAIQEIHRLQPREILIPTSLFDEEVFLDQLPKSLLTPRKSLDIKKSESLLREIFSIPSSEVLGLKDPGSVLSLGLLFAYVQETQKQTLPHINAISEYHPSQRMILDSQTLRHLEIFNPIMQEEKSSTLWSVFEKSCTAMGGRTLRQNLAAPLLDQKQILSRHEAVSACIKNTSALENLTETLSGIADIERIMARIATLRGNARDLVHLRDSLVQMPKVAALAKEFVNNYFDQKVIGIQSFDVLRELLEEALVDNPPVEITQGGMMRDGYDKVLDEYRNLGQNAQAWLDEFLQKKKKETGINGLRVKYHKNFGFCLEVSTGQKALVPADWTPRQTLVNAERYTTPELADYEQKALSAESEGYAREHELFLLLREEAMKHLQSLQKASQALGSIDMIVTLARTALRLRWVCPTLIEGATLNITEGRHPVVEALSKERFVPNDLKMGEDTLHLITGPNMAGKSTFLRQNALIILLAQIGSFVPAKKVEMPLFDRVFTRVGASDNVAAGKSTFFVEMTETASILRQATAKSFLILDEIGRGTSTFDGISLAWSVMEYLHNKTKAKTLFATHYHELIDLAQDLSYGENYHISVSQNAKGIVFLRTIKKGGMSDSFGIEVAKLAGVPSEVVSNAREVLSRLESESLLSGKPNLFSLAAPEKKVSSISPAEVLLENIDPDALSPKEALEFLYELKKSI